MRVYAAVLAAGSGSRFGGDKVMANLRGRPVWLWSYEALSGHPEVAGVGVIGSEAVIESARSLAPNALFVEPGGATRPESCLAAINALPADADLVLIHDAARPIVDPGVVSRVIAAAARSGAAAPGIAVTDTIKRVTESGVETIDRAELRAMQTPQAAKVSLLKKAFETEGAMQATDEMKLMEALGMTPEIVEGSVRGVKITLPEDLSAVSSWLGPIEKRTGIGYDVHAFSQDPNRPMWLGGVEFDDRPGLEGHSDADALIHAVVDALLGAAALGDIGVHFPPADPQWKDAPSVTFLKHAAYLLNKEGWSVRNVDATVIAERPKIMARAKIIRETLAQALGIDPSRVSVKATTNEKLGAIGRGEGVAAFATATIAQFP